MIYFPPDPVLTFFHRWPPASARLARRSQLPGRRPTPSSIVPISMYALSSYLRGASPNRESIPLFPSFPACPLLTVPFYRRALPAPNGAPRTVSLPAPVRSILSHPSPTPGAYCPLFASAAPPPLGMIPPSHSPIRGLPLPLTFPPIAALLTLPHPSIDHTDHRVHPLPERVVPIPPRRDSRSSLAKQ
ncbi:hypothetical protein HYPSUDRAFT_209877 [Hypholoma sublateritium FD-334 SS-4]|uniref:Uncharacterized protein n=1 Tax=Hypholoma sublateritium (strain FD-334 SS-4) TaxID=945553 RepID=A0A0D2KEY8_HYPSF|nr:hypothetical protein HYPSUDRAFT_209877 [Hypholoma sublateritium FD-334 SS-4]